MSSVGVLIWGPVTLEVFGKIATISNKQYYTHRKWVNVSL